MTHYLLVRLKKYSLAILVLAVGFLMITFGISNQQNTSWYLASVMILVTGSIIFLYSNNSMKFSFGKLITYIVGLISIILLASAGYRIRNTITYDSNYKKSELLIQENLNCIRIAQQAYLKKNTFYAQSWEELEKFIKKSVITEVRSKGEVPLRKLTQEESQYLYKSDLQIDHYISEHEAVLLSKNSIQFPEFINFQRDTLKLSFLNAQFLNKIYSKRRNKAHLGKFCVDSLKYIPYTGAREKLKMKTINQVLIENEKVALLEVKGLLPFPKIQGSKKRELIYLGSLSVPNLTGSWE